jgi:hypothetical protein
MTIVLLGFIASSFIGIAWVIAIKIWKLVYNSLPKKLRE